MENDELGTLDASEEGQPQWSANGSPLTGDYGTWSFPISFTSINYWTYAVFHGLTARTEHQYGFPTLNTKTTSQCDYVIDSPRCDIIVIGY